MMMILLLLKPILAIKCMSSFTSFYWLAYGFTPAFNSMFLIEINLEWNSISTFLFFYFCLFQRPDQYKMKILVFSIQYDFQIPKYQYSIWRILSKYQYAEKNEVSVFSISILSGKKAWKNKQNKQIWKIEVNLSLYCIDISLKI